MSTWYIIPKDDDLIHYGVKYRSGRRPGFGKASSTSNADNNLRKKIGPDIKIGNNTSGKKYKISDNQIRNLARKWSPSKNNPVNKLLKMLRASGNKENLRIAERLANAIVKYSKNYNSYSGVIITSDGKVNRGRMRRIGPYYKGYTFKKDNKKNPQTKKGRRV